MCAHLEAAASWMASHGQPAHDEPHDACQLRTQEPCLEEVQSGASLELVDINHVNGQQGRLSSSKKKTNDVRSLALGLLRGKRPGNGSSRAPFSRP